VSYRPLASATRDKPTGASVDRFRASAVAGRVRVTGPILNSRVAGGACLAGGAGVSDGE
jgi:hypothetical protein